MNNRLFIIALTALSLSAITCSAQRIPTPLPAKKTLWFESGAQWLRAAQSSNHGWGTLSNGDRMHDVSQPVIDDPATTALVAMALLEAGGPLQGNPHSPNILQAMDYILNAIHDRPGNGSLTPLPISSLQQELGIKADVCMSVDFLLAMQKQLPEDDRIRSAVDVCFALLENGQVSKTRNSDDTRILLRNTTSTTPLSFTAQCFTDTDAIEFTDENANSPDAMASGIRILGGAGIALFRAASLTETTDDAPKEFDDVLRDMSFEAVYSLLTKGIDAIANGVEQKSIARKESKRMANSCLANAFRSDTLEHEDYTNWIEWRSETEVDFAGSQKPNGSWSGQHCTHGPIVCTAAMLLAWHGDPGNGSR